MMEPLLGKFIVTAGMISLSVVFGAFCRRRNWAGDRAAEALMTFVAVFGYPVVGFLSIWGIRLTASDLALPVMAGAQCVVMTFVSLALSGFVSRDSSERGLLAIAGGVGNNGFTMGAFVLYLLAGEEGLALSGVYGLIFTPVVVFLLYPIAKRYSSKGPPTSLLRLALKNLTDWRSIGLPVTVMAMALSWAGIRRPAFVSDLRLVDVITYTSLPAAFFAIGLRLRLSGIWDLRRHVLWLAGMRFVGGACVGVALAAITRLTPWGFHGVRWTVFVVQSFVPMSVSSVAVANMFSLKADEASALFVANTFMYLALVLPIVFGVF